VNSTDQGIVWSGATSFNASASWFGCLSFNVRMLLSSLRGAWAEERLLRAQGILFLIRGITGFSGRRAFLFLFAAGQLSTWVRANQRGKETSKREK
jgi:hypothetical protein